MTQYLIYRGPMLTYIFVRSLRLPGVFSLSVLREMLSKARLDEEDLIFINERNISSSSRDLVYDRLPHRLFDNNHSTDVSQP